MILKSLDKVYPKLGKGICALGKVFYFELSTEKYCTLRVRDSCVTEFYAKVIIKVVSTIVDTCDFKIAGEGRCM